MAHEELFETVFYYHDGSGNQYNNVLHWGVTAVSGSIGWEMARSLGADLANAIGQPLGDCVGDDVFGDYITARRLQPNPSPKFMGPLGLTGHSPIPNEHSGPANAAGVISFVCSDQNKHNGRMFVGGIPYSHMPESRIDSDMTTRLLTLGAALINFIATATPPALAVALVVYHKQAGTFSEVGDCFINTKPGSQRKRLLPVF